jgi:drug/metabolite transporter (DMT)-like permease
VVRLRGLRLVAAMLVVIGLLLIVTGGDHTIARGMLVAGLLYAVLYLVIERRGRGRY